MIFYRDATFSALLLPLVNQRLNFTYSRSHAFHYGSQNTNSGFCGYLGVLLAANRVFSLLSDNTGMVPRTFWTWFGRFLTPARSSLPTDGRWARGGAQAPSCHSSPRTSFPTSPKSLGRLETDPSPVCRPPVAPEPLIRTTPEGSHPYLASTVVGTSCSKFGRPRKSLQRAATDPRLRGTPRTSMMIFNNARLICSPNGYRVTHAVSGGIAYVRGLGLSQIVDSEPR